MADRSRAEQAGTASLLIIGLAVVLLMMAAVVTDASAAYLQRQGLDTIADGAALTAADAGASGEEAYGAGLGEDLQLDAATAREAALAYVAQVGAFRRYPGLTVRVAVVPTLQRVVVSVSAPVRLPLHVPGSPAHATIGARSAATVGVD